MVWGKEKLCQGSKEQEKELKCVNANDSWKFIEEKSIEKAYAPDQASETHSNT